MVFGCCIAAQVVEQGGFVWLFYGDEALPAEERPPIPYTPELDDPSWKPVYGKMVSTMQHHAVITVLTHSSSRTVHSQTLGALVCNTQQMSRLSVQNLVDLFRSDAL